MPFPQLVLKSPSPRKGGTRGIKGSRDRDGCPTAPWSLSPPPPVPTCTPGTVLGQGHGMAKGQAVVGPVLGKAHTSPWLTHTAARICCPSHPTSNSPLSTPSPPKPPPLAKRMRHHYLQGQAGKAGQGGDRGKQAIYPEGDANSDSAGRHPRWEPSRKLRGGSRCPKHAISIHPRERAQP